MAWFDFLFKRKKPRTYHQEPFSPTPEEMEHYREESKHWDDAHYYLAHGAFRRVALARPLEFIEACCFPEEYLKKMVDLASRNFPDQPLRFSAEDFQVRTIKLGSYPGVLIEMPPPSVPPEAFFVALIVLEDINNPLPRGATVPARYFTLERGDPVDGQERTLLCEWTTAMHKNYGAGPPPVGDEFLEAIHKVLMTGEPEMEAGFNFDP